MGNTQGRKTHSIARSASSPARSPSSRPGSRTPCKCETKINRAEDKTEKTKGGVRDRVNHIVHKAGECVTQESSGAVSIYMYAF